MKLIEGMSATYLMAAMICVIIASTCCPAAATDDYTNFMKLIIDSEDVRINAQDLAFLLVTHGFDATPKDSYAIVKLDKKIYKVTPNGVKPGLADISISD
jgi:hypothetical protein